MVPTVVFTDYDVCRLKVSLVCDLLISHSGGNG